MNHSARQGHSWSHLMARFAQEVSTPDYRFGPLSFALAQGGPTIVAELLDDGRTLGLTVDLQQAPEAARLEAFLVANGIENAQDSGVYAYFEVRNTLLFFRRLEDAGACAYEDLVREMQVFSQTAQVALDALPQALQVGAAPPTPDASVSHTDTFRHVWADFAFAQGLGQTLPEPEDDGSVVLSLEGDRHVFVCPDAARACIVLKTTLALLPLWGDEPAAWLALLQAHTLGQGTGGVVFAIDADAQEVIAWRSLPLAGLDGYGLNDAIDSLAEVVRFYTEKLDLDAVAA